MIFSHRIRFQAPVLLAALSIVASASMPANAQIGSDTKAPATSSGKVEVSSLEEQIEPLASPEIVSRALTIVPGNAPVIKELGILDYQLDQLKTIRYDLQKKLGEASRTTAKMAGPEKRKVFNQIYVDTHSELKVALLPNQFERLLQLSLQSFGLSPLTGDVDLANLIGNPIVQRQLSLPASKIAQIRQKMLEENKRVAKEIERLKSEAQANVLSVLDASDRQELEQLVGKPFDFEGLKPGRGGKFVDSDDH